MSYLALKKLGEELGNMLVDQTVLDQRKRREARRN
jgi:hypothetical protein